MVNQRRTSTTAGIAMIEFQNVVFMDFQKAATSSIVAFLRSNLEEKEHKKKDVGAHRPAEKGHDTGKFHFISVRNPLTTYISLFGHGCSKLGGMYKGFKKRGLDHLYVPTPAGFERWLEFMMESKNAGVIKKKYAQIGLSELCGPLTYRLMMLSVVDPLAAMKDCDSDRRDGIVQFFHQNRIYSYYVRTEELVNDLFTVLTSCADRVKLKDPLTTPEELRARIPRKNVGAKIEGLTSDAVSEELRARVREYEWLIYETFGYDDHAKGRSPPLSPPSTSDVNDRALLTPGEGHRVPLEANSR
jgi:hypothetical protein